MKRPALLCYAMLPLAAGDAVLAAGESFAVSAGLEYSTGNYGGRQSTDIWYLPVTLRHERESWLFKATLPYLRITGPDDVIAGFGRAVRMTPAAETRRSASGQGDVVLSATRNVHHDPQAGLLLDLTVKAKLATADADKGLGTGKNDMSAAVDLSRHHGAWTLFGTLGWRRMGDPADIDFRNPWFASLGAGWRTGAGTRFGAAYDARQPVLAGGGRLAELSAWAAWDPAPNSTVQVYVVRGLADGSPERGYGATMTWRF